MASRQTVRVSHAAPGRHRAQPTPGRSSAIAVLGAVALAVALVLAGVGWWLVNRSSSSETPELVPSPTRQSPSPDPRLPSAQVDSERIVTINGDVVTVEETSTIVDGDTTKALPATTGSLGLDLIDASIVTADGRTRPFNDATKLSSSGTLTTRGRYRLTDCPDLLPAQWPSPTDFPQATRTYSRLEEPLHTAYAICPKERSTAERLAGLEGTVADTDTPTVRLTWSGSSRLTVASVGSASGVAALVVEPGCGGACAFAIDPDGAVTVALQAVDPCPPATDNDTLTLKVDGGGIVAVRVPALHQKVCQQ